MHDNEAPLDCLAEIPASFDQYYLNVVRTCMTFAVPISAAVYVAFFGWDCLFVKSLNLGVKTLFLRLGYAVLALALLPVVKRIRSNTTMTLVSGFLYSTALLNLVLILILVPDGLVNGVAGFVLVSMFAVPTTLPRPITALISGAIGFVGLIVGGMTVHLPYTKLVSASIFFGSGVLGSWIFLLLLNRELRNKHALELSLLKEKQQSERLLKEILPRYVIQRIREGASDIAEALSEVNVIFIDVVGFTMMAKKLSPKHLVEILGEIFRAFDDLCNTHQVTKIKTIGDAYMAATGAPEAATGGATAAIQFSQNAIEVVESISLRTGIPMSIRVGVATGAAISGVLTLKRPAYDLWGETVNLASRLEGTSAPGRIHIAETTYWRIKETFNCEARGVIDVKGIGSIATYFISEHSDRRKDVRPNWILPVA